MGCQPNEQSNESIIPGESGLPPKKDLKISNGLWSPPPPPIPSLRAVSLYMYHMYHTSQGYSEPDHKLVPTL